VLNSVYLNPHSAFFFMYTPFKTKQHTDYNAL